MTMNYKLAKKLKDAGYDQELLGCYDATTYQDKTFKPTLEELIMTCGDKFYILLKNDNDNDWVAIGCDVENCCGKTPSEAVARLWLKLNK